MARRSTATCTRYGLRSAHAVVWHDLLIPRDLYENIQNEEKSWLKEIPPKVSVAAAGYNIRWRRTREISGILQRTLLRKTMKFYLKFYKVKTALFCCEFWASRKRDFKLVEASFLDRLKALYVINNDVRHDSGIQMITAKTRWYKERWRDRECVEYRSRPKEKCCQKMLKRGEQEKVRKQEPYLQLIHSASGWRRMRMPGAQISTFFPILYLVTGSPY